MAGGYQGQTEIEQHGAIWEGLQEREGRGTQRGKGAPKEEGLGEGRERCISDRDVTNEFLRWQAARHNLCQGAPSRARQIQTSWG